VDWYMDRGVRTAVTELRREIKAQLARHADASQDELADAELITGELWVAADIGGQMEQEYRRASGAQGQPLSAEQIAECLVRLKAAIGGTFRVVEVMPERIVLVNSRCPFGAEVQHSPSLCRMTSAVFGGIAARNADEAAVSLDERIAVGDPGCRVVVHLGAAAKSAQRAHHYTVAH